jgi:TRAP-type transport system periplasmic protein
VSISRKALLAVASTFALAACTAGAGGGGTAEGGGADGDPIKLRYAFFAPAESFPGVQMQKWKEELEKRTDGQVEVELFPGGTLLSAGDIYDGVSAGTVDIGLDSPSYDESRFPFSSVINAPIGMEKSQTSSPVFLDLLTEFEPAEFADFEIITAFTTEAAYYQTKDKVASIADARGLELRSAATAIPILERMKAAPVGMAMPDVAEALQTGVISGYVSSRDVLQDFGLAEHLNYVTDYPLGISTGFVAVMDKERYESLPDDVKNVIQELKPEMMEFTAQYHDEENIANSMAFAEEQGVELVEVTDSAEWDAIMDEVAGQWVESHADAGFDAAAVLERARELAEEYESGGE